jgi:hypothetical protein
MVYNDALFCVIHKHVPMRLAQINVTDVFRPDIFCPTKEFFLEYTQNWLILFEFS